MEWTCTAVVWEWNGKGAWHFVTIPIDFADTIQSYIASSGIKRAGFGSVRATVTLGSTTWETSLFPDKKSESYLLPLKKAVRTKEHISVGDTITLTLALGAIS